MAQVHRPQNGWRVNPRWLGVCLSVSVAFVLVLLLFLLAGGVSRLTSPARAAPAPAPLAAPIVALSKSVDPKQVAAGQVLTYLLTVTNTSSTTTTMSLIVSDTVPADTTFQDASFKSVGGFVGPLLLGETGVERWMPVSQLAPSGTMQLEFTVKVAPRLREGTIITNAAYKVYEQQSGTITGGPVTATVQAPALTISKQADRSQVCGNQRIGYTLTVTNVGHLASTGPITMVDRMPVSTTFAASWPTYSFNPASGLITWTLSTLAPNQAVTVTLAVTNPASTPYSTTLVNVDYSAAAPDVADVATGTPLTVTAINLSAGFTNTTLRVGQVMTFFNTSAGATGYLWNFGDGSPLSTAINPTHTFAITGNYMVVLTATGQCGIDVAVKPLNVLTTLPKVFLPITFNNYPPKVAFSLSNFSVGENAPTATIQVILSGASSMTVTVDYATGDGTAVAGRDYIFTGGTLTFAPGQITKTFSVGIISDTISESDETVILTLNNPVNAILGAPNPATLTILDDDHPPPGCAPQVWYTMTSAYSPMGMAYDAAGDRLFVANRDGPGGGSLAVINPSSRQTMQVVTGLLSVQSVAFDVNRNRIYVVGGSSLYVIDGTSYGISRTISVGAGAYGVAYNPLVNKIYVTGYLSDSITIVNAVDWSVITTLTSSYPYTLTEPSYIAVNMATSKVYVTNHNRGVPPSWVTVVNGNTDRIITNTMLYQEYGRPSGDVYGITVDSVHNRVYVASISAARVYAINGANDTPLGDIQIVRGSTPVPLRMVAVNPVVGSNTHLWLTSSASEDWRGMDRLIVLSFDPASWPPASPLPLATVVAPSPTYGLVLDPTSGYVFASNANSNQVTVSRDSTTLCPTPLRMSAGAGDLYTVVHDYSHPQSDR